MTRIAIDWDDDGAFAIITRPGVAAEVVRLAHREVILLMQQAAGAVLAESRRPVPVEDDAPGPAIGMLGE